LNKIAAPEVFNMQQPLRKSFFDDPLFPFHIVYKDRKPPQQELPEHLHDRYELVYVYGGKGTFFLNRTFYDMSEGDLFMIPGNTIHRAFPAPEDPVTSTALFFSPSLVQLSPLGESYSNLHCYDMARKTKRYKLPVPADLRRLVETELANMQDELQSKRLGYRHAVCMHLHSILLCAGRLSAQGYDGADATGIQVGPEWMQPILQYIDLHHTEPGLSLSGLAARVAVSAAHFSRVFKQLTGMNVTDYVNAKRIVTAKELLVATPNGIEHIAEQCGYESLPHFHRLFKKLTGTTPGAYRRGQVHRRG
jgi:AraC-like DNA-binding protein